MIQLVLVLFFGLVIFVRFQRIMGYTKKLLLFKIVCKIVSEGKHLNIETTFHDNIKNKFVERKQRGLTREIRNPLSEINLINETTHRGSHNGNCGDPDLIIAHIALFIKSGILN